MKNYFKLIIMLFTITLFTSCSLDIEPQDAKHISLEELQLNELAVNDTTNRYAVRIYDDNTLFVINPDNNETLYEIDVIDIGDTIGLTMILFVFGILIGAIINNE